MPIRSIVRQFFTSLPYWRAGVMTSASLADGKRSVGQTRYDVLGTSTKRLNKGTPVEGSNIKTKLEDLKRGKIYLRYVIANPWTNVESDTYELMNIGPQETISLTSTALLVRKSWTTVLGCRCLRKSLSRAGCAQIWINKNQEIFLGFNWWRRRVNCDSTTSWNCNNATMRKNPPEKIS